MPARYDVGEPVRVLTHPARPRVTVTGRWDGAGARDPYDEDIYAVSGFVTRQRESSLARDGFEEISLEPLAGWRMAGAGGFRRAGPGIVESEGGPGLLWYTRHDFEDFVLLVDWRLAAPDDNSGVFVRVPPLAQDLTPALAEGYEIQIDERGVDPATGATDDPRHRTGAVYTLAPAVTRASRPVGRWNTFEIEARGARVTVRLNGVPVSELARAEGRRRRGHVALQCHHPGSRVQFRSLLLRTLRE